MSLRCRDHFDPNWAYQTQKYDKPMILDKECRYFLEAFLYGFLHKKCHYGDFDAEFNALAENAVRATNMSRALPKSTWPLRVAFSYESLIIAINTLRRMITPKSVKITMDKKVKRKLLDILSPTHLFEISFSVLDLPHAPMKFHCYH